MIHNDDMFIPILSTTFEYELPGYDHLIYRATAEEGDLQVEYRFAVDDEDADWIRLNDDTFDYFVGALIWHYEVTAKVAWTKNDYYAAAGVCTAAGYVLSESTLVKICGISTQWNEGPYSRDECMRNYRNFYHGHKIGSTFCEGAD
mgnify:CR=1 FL=1